MAESAKRCGFLTRWWHRRLRKIDREIMFPALLDAAVRYSNDPQARAAMVDAAWAAFIESPGQEHWRCACSAGQRQSPLA